MGDAISPTVYQRDRIKRIIAIEIQVSQQVLKIRQQAKHEISQTKPHITKQISLQLWLSQKQSLKPATQESPDAH